jgi:hypothetical protein
MIIDIPKVGEVEFPDSMSEQEINAAAKRLYDEANAPVAETSGMARAGQLLARGAAPVAAGAGIGALAGGAPGALIGSMAVPIADAATLIGNELNKGNVAVENYVRNLLGMQARQVAPTPMPSQALSQGMAQMGLPEPTSTGERVIEAIGSGVGGAATQLPALSRLATTAATETGRNLAGRLAQAPATQVAVSAPAAGAAQFVGETTESPALGMLAGAGVGALGGIRSQVRERAPNAEQLKIQSEIAYKNAEKAGVIVSPESFKAKIPNFVEKLRSEGYYPETKLYPQLDSVLKILDSESATPKTLKQLEDLRKVIKSPAAIFDNPAQQKLTYDLLDEFDDYVSNLSTKDLIKGKADVVKAAASQGADVDSFVKNLNKIQTANPERATKELNKARKLYARSKKSDVMSDIIERAELKAGANFTQSGLENALRQELKSLALNKKRMAGFTKAEQNAIKAAAKGGNVQNVLRSIGKYAATSPIPAYIGAGGGAAIGSAIAGPVGAAVGTLAVPAVGGLARAGATRIGMNRLQELQDMIALGRMPENQRRTRLMGVTGIRGLLSSPEERQQLIDEETNLGQ